MRRLDFHCHADTDDPALWDALAQTCRANNTVVAICGGLRYGECDYLPNDDVLKMCNRHPEWMIPLAKLDLWQTADPNEVYRYAEAGFKGFKCIYPWYEYDHDLYMPVYEAAQECNLPILFHTGNYRPCEADTIYRRPVLKNMQPINLDRICRAFPKLHVVMAHLGTRIFEQQASQFLGMLPNLYADLAGNAHFARLTGADMLAMLCNDIRLVDPNRNSLGKIVLGSDSYVTRPDIMAEAQGYYEHIFKRVGVPQDLFDAIMGATAASWLGVSLDD